MIKTKVVFENHNPLHPDVTFVAIQTSDEGNHNVFAVYRARQKKDLPDLPSDIVVMSAVSANRLFTFVKGKLSEL